MTTLKIVIPTYEKGSRLDELEVKGHIEVNSECDNLSEGYEQLKVEIEHLLEKIQAENKIVADLKEIAEEIRKKEAYLASIKKDIEYAQRQYERLKNFLNRLGINPRDYQLVFHNDLVLEPETKSVSIVDDDDDDDDEDPIPM